LVHSRALHTLDDGGGIFMGISGRHFGCSRHHSAYGYLFELARGEAAGLFATYHAHYLTVVHYE